MITLIMIILLIVVGGWVDSRLDWRQAGRDEREGEQV